MREADFQLYVEVLGKLVPWFFVMGHTNYARWLPVHIRDMIGLKSCHPAVYTEFQRGHFVVQKAANKFSTMGMDQAHEQMNEVVKGEGGAVGLTENAAALHRWMVVGPEMARAVESFNLNCNGSSKNDDHSHHDQNLATQKAFAANVHALVDEFNKHGNPFKDDSKELFSLVEKDVIGQDIVERMTTLEQTGKDQYESFVKERLESNVKTINDTIPRCKSLIFKEPAKPKQNSKLKQDLINLKNDCSLFSRLYISCQSHDGDLDDFFRHENVSYPPSLSDGGKLEPAESKSDILECLLPRSKTPKDVPTVDAMIFDGPAIVHMLQPG